MSYKYNVMATTDAARIMEESDAPDAKFPFIIDRAKVLETFFHYSAHTCCLVEPMIKAVMSGAEVDPVAMGELMRKAYVSGAKYGYKTVYRMGGGVPTSFEKWFGKGPGKFDPEIVFNPQKFKERDHFAQVVLPAEDKDRMGNNEIWPVKDMNIIILCEADNEDTIQKIIKQAHEKIPDFDQHFNVYVSDN